MKWPYNLVGLYIALLEDVGDDAEDEDQEKELGEESLIKYYLIKYQRGFILHTKKLFSFFPNDIILK